VHGRWDHVRRAFNERFKGITQVWFPRAVAAKHENLHEWLDTYPEARWVYSHDNVRAMQDVMHDFSVGTNANKFGKTIRKKLGDDFREVSRQLVHFLASILSWSFLNCSCD
jgi:hypothetical protein